MNDSVTTLQELKKFCDDFVEERDWKQFHAPKNLSMAIASEAAELMELLLWCESGDSQKEVDRQRTAVEEELADIITAAFMFANMTNIDIAQAIEKKMVKNRLKYPIEKSKGKSTKYTEL